MAIHECDEFCLTEFYLEPGFHLALVREMRPWLQKINMVRNTIYKRATHATAKDAWVWMRRFERMIVNAVGDSGKFLPDDEEKKNARSHEEPDGDAGEEGFVVVHE